MPVPMQIFLRARDLPFAIKVIALVKDETRAAKNIWDKRVDLFFLMLARRSVLSSRKECYADNVTFFFSFFLSLIVSLHSIDGEFLRELKVLKNTHVYVFVYVFVCV